MQLHCLGTAGYHPNEHRHTSCYFLPESGILLDAGTGLFRLPPLIQTDSLDILISHAHLDHIAGLTFLLDVLYQRPVQQLRIWGEQEKLDAIRQHLFCDLIFPVQLDAQWCPLDGRQPLKIGGGPAGPATVTWRAQQHPGGSLGFRLDWEREPARTRLLYLTDTTGDDSQAAIDWYRGADLMLHECYFPASHRELAIKTGHTWTQRLAEIAAAAEPAELIMTHVNPLSADPESLLAEVAERLATTGVVPRLAAEPSCVQFGHDCGGA
ncbi:MBL fold metallo-hydrolase [Stieleria sp. TO1_6]|uniref:MBL fold metallo-hydrolase n=1 Tax=Stieleria tagensis TaxID=2956795 RepID=UPI00209B7AF1|nr:MBL fold metallo-hydrolase [Stieleria tagensis]MCO8120218.1 MBL fold metallo-hydrolase [Stieleria tagensis]